jgi:uncharacterized protein YndB with AHSA1/START domain
MSGKNSAAMATAKPSDREIIPRKSLSRNGWCSSAGPMDEAGNLLFEIRNTVTFVEIAGKTRVTLRASIVSQTAAAPAYLAGMEMGWTQSLERLEALVAKG